MSTIRILFASYSPTVLDTKANPSAICAVHVDVEVIFLSFQQCGDAIVLRLALYISTRNLSISERRIFTDFHSSRFWFGIDLPQRGRIPVLSIISFVWAEYQKNRRCPISG